MEYDLGNELMTSDRYLFEQLTHATYNNENTEYLYKYFIEKSEYGRVIYVGTTNQYDEHHNRDINNKQNVVSLPYLIRHKDNTATYLNITFAILEEGCYHDSGTIRLKNDNAYVIAVDPGYAFCRKINDDLMKEMPYGTIMRLVLPYGAGYSFEYDAKTINHKNTTSVLQEVTIYYAQDFLNTIHFNDDSKCIFNSSYASYEESTIDAGSHGAFVVIIGDIKTNGMFSGDFVFSGFNI